MSRSARWSAAEREAIASGGSFITASTVARSSTPAAVSVSAFTRRSPSALRALDQAAALEPVDDPGHVRGVAEEPFGERAHRQRLFGVEHAQGVGLREAEPELGELRAHLRALRHADLEEQPLRLVRGGRSIGDLRRHCFR